MGNFRNFKICDRCGCKVEEGYTTVSMTKIVINGNDDDIVDTANFELCNACGNAVYDFISENPLPKFGDE